MAVLKVLVCPRSSPLPWGTLKNGSPKARGEGGLNHIYIQQRQKYECIALRSILEK
jgi:hypothetical protein